MSAIKSIMERAYEKHLVIPAFNMPYIPMMKPVVKALQDSDTFGLIEVARLEWVKFSSGSLEAVAEEYRRCSDFRVTRLHLDHVPVVGIGIKGAGCRIHQGKGTGCCLGN